MPDTDAVTQEQPRSHVLVADDEAIAAMALERFLTRKGYRVTTACDGREALAIHRQDPADIVVTDMRMPRGGGHELIGNLRSTDDLLPIVVMTGYMSPNEEEAIPAGDRLVVMQKPIEVERLLEIIRSFTG
ncbi:response regulator [Skermanella rosea]|uniref:response regulator n=1 Tax=Skermanella rosea TaxID=1817965 RepID=UPI0019348A09|nr:response regulator [Skermanella rosea]UEM04133.1 response regulator [Skermanella rosea]